MYCRICDGLLPEHRPYVVWHTGWDGCEECDRDYAEGVVVCAECIEVLRYAGIGLDGDVYVGGFAVRGGHVGAEYALARFLDAGACDRMRSRLRPPLSEPFREQGC